MTNINCCADCIYQKDGKCNFADIKAQTSSPDKDCVYYVKAELH